MRISLPYPPSINNYYRNFNGRIIISKAGREYRQLVESLMRDFGQPMEGKLAVRIEMHPPDNKRRDVDNVLKSLLDALQHGGAYKDDSQIYRLSIEKLTPIKNGYTTIEIEAI